MNGSILAVFKCSFIMHNLRTCLSVQKAEWGIVTSKSQRGNQRIKDLNSLSLIRESECT